MIKPDADSKLNVSIGYVFIGISIYKQTYKASYEWCKLKNIKSNFDYSLFT